MSTALSPIRSMQRPTSIMCIAHSRLSGIVADFERSVEDLAVQPVDLVVLAHQVLRHLDVAALEGLTALDDLLPRLVAHALDELEHLRIRRRLMSGQGHELRHVHALVAHPLDVLDHVQQRRDDAQVAGHRRLEREQRQDPLVHLQIAAVDAVVVGDHHARELDVLVLDGLERAVERGRHEVEASERGSLQSRELFLEVRSGGVRQRHYPTFPVTYASVRESAGFVKIFSVSSNSTTRPVRFCSSSSSSTVKKAVLSDTRAACCML